MIKIYIMEKQEIIKLLEKHGVEDWNGALEGSTSGLLDAMEEYANLRLGVVSSSADLKDKFFKKVEQIAQTYHDRLCMSGLTMEGQICKCCESVVLTTTSIEHDSQDYSKDLSVCVNCYSHIATWWKNNRPRKIAPI